MSSLQPWWRKYVVSFVISAFTLFCVGIYWAHNSAFVRRIFDGNGVSGTHLGQLGDSFGPLTSFFAAIAAAGAWLGYLSQREQLAQEYRHSASVKFDDVFFRLLDFYDLELAKVVIADRGNVFGGRFEGPLALKSFYSLAMLAIEAERLAANKAAPAPTILKITDELLRVDDSRVFMQLSIKIVAIASWLQSLAVDVDVGARGALLTSRLNAEERWFWCYCLGRESDSLVEFAAALGLTEEDCNAADLGPRLLLTRDALLAQRAAYEEGR